MSALGSLGSALLAFAGGTAVGAGVTGWFTVQVKRTRRVQKRRAKVYIDMLAWINARMPMLRAKAEQEPVPAHEASSADLKGTYPDPEASGSPETTDPPDKPYFRTLRARVVAFGSHDTARAFDSWTEAYLKVLNGEENEPWCETIGKAGVEEVSYLQAIVVPPSPVPPFHAKEPEISRWEKHRVFKRDFKRLNGMGWLPIWVAMRIDPGLPKPEPGGLTMAIERCVSNELRKG
jgi:hypothetical protein